MNRAKSRQASKNKAGKSPAKSRYRSETRWVINKNKKAARHRKLLKKHVERALEKQKTKTEVI